MPGGKQRLGHGMRTRQAIPQRVRTRHLCQGIVRPTDPRPFWVASGSFLGPVCVPSVSPEAAGWRSRAVSHMPSPNGGSFRPQVVARAVLPRTEADRSLLEEALAMGAAVRLCSVPRELRRGGASPLHAGVSVARARARSLHDLRRVRRGMPHLARHHEDRRRAGVPRTDGVRGVGSAGGAPPRTCQEHVGRLERTGLSRMSRVRRRVSGAHPHRQARRGLRGAAKHHCARTSGTDSNPRCASRAPTLGGQGLSRGCAAWVALLSEVPRRW